ncbi:MAG: hypothetical protein K0S23_2184 [Fluviicola sp.]|jgi:hypothetical protein|nr:hypothetical protein [Fluviicola sp.]
MNGFVSGKIEKSTRKIHRASLYLFLLLINSCETGILVKYFRDLNSI